MKLLHNASFSAICTSAAERLEIASRFEEEFGAELGPYLQFEDLSEAKLDTLYTFKLYLKHQRYLKLIPQLLSKLPSDERMILLKQAIQRLTSRQNFFFRLDKQAFLEQQIHYVSKGDVIQVRLNLAAHPNTQERALELLKSLLDPQ